MRVSCRHPSVIGPEDLFHQYGSIRVLSRLAVILCTPRRSVRIVHLISCRWIEYYKCSQRRVMIAVILRLANVPRPVDQIETAGVSLSLRPELLAANENDEQENDH